MANMWSTFNYITANVTAKYIVAATVNKQFEYFLPEQSAMMYIKYNSYLVIEIDLSLAKHKHQFAFWIVSASLPDFWADLLAPCGSRV